MDDNKLIVVEQAVIPFHGSDIFAFRLSDDRIVASLSSLCKMLKLAKHGQMERIRRDKDLARQLLLISVQTANGLQRVDVMIDEAVHSWVMGIQVNLVAPEKRPLILALKVEIVDVLHRHFFPAQTDQMPPSTEATPQPSSSHSSSGTAPNLPWERLFEGVHVIQEALHDIQQHEERMDKHLAQRFAGFEEWLTSLDRRGAATSQPSSAEVGWLPGLSPAHLADLRTLLRSLEQATGYASLQLEQELVETFGSPTVNAIADEQWQDVLAWCIWRAQQPR